MYDAAQFIFNGTVVSSKIIAVGVKEITFSLDKQFEFKSGQYVWVEIINTEINDPRGSRRAFSISNIKNEDNTISIILRIGDSMYKQAIFSLDTGDVVRIHGPFGSSFTLSDEVPKNLIFVCSGVSISPFLSVVSQIFKDNSEYKIDLFWSNTSEQLAPKINDVKKIFNAQNNANLHLLNREVKWQDFGEVFGNLNTDYKVWVAGTQGFVNRIYKELQIGGVSLNDMVFENYYPTIEYGLTLEQIKKSFADDNILSQAIQSSTNHIIITDPNGTILFANKAAARLTGYTNSEMVGNTPRIWGGVMEPKFYKDFWKRKLSGQTFDGEIANRRKNGDLYYTIAHISSIVDEDKRIVGFIGTEEDVTEQHNLSEKLRQSQIFLDSVVENLPTVITVKNAKTLKFAKINKAAESVFGLEEHQVLGKTVYELFDNTQADLINKYDLELINSKSDIDVGEIKLKTKDGIRLFNFRQILISNMLDPEQLLKDTYILTMYDDITDQREKTEELEKMNKLMVGREIKMIELKEKLNKLS